MNNLEILVISDSHRKLNNVYKVIDNLQKSINIIIHCGDNVDDAKKIKAKYDIPLEMVKGNCDFDPFSVGEVFLEIEGKKILVTHGHNYNVKYGLTNLYYKGLERGADIILFGHSHCAGISETNGIYMINPGSISEPRDGGNPSYALVSISNGRVFPVICRLNE